MSSLDPTRPRGRLPFFAGFGIDETVYSAISRYGFHIGLDRPVWLNEHLLGIRSHEAVHPEMPAGLRLIAERMHRAEYRDVDVLINNHTLYPYRTAFLPAEDRDRILRHLREDEIGDLVVRGNKRGWVPHATALRSCAECDREADAEGRDRQWSRVHQLPLVTVCVRHGLPLSDGPNMKRCRVKYIRSGAHPASAQTGADAWSDREWHARRWLAERSSTILHQGPSELQIRLARRPSELFREKGYDAGWGNDRKAILDRGTQVLRGLTGFLPQLAGNERALRRWLTTAPTAGSGRAEDVLVLEYLLECLPEGQGPSRPTSERLFGPPPYQCRNPFADHAGERHAIMMGDPERLRGGRIAHFKCSCGHEYRMSMSFGGRNNPHRTVALGPALLQFVIEAQAEGVDIKAAAAKISLSPSMLFELADRDKAISGWTRPRLRVRFRGRKGK